MDYYLIQKEEKEIDSGLANRLVEILVADLGFLKIDAKLKIKHFYGILKVHEEKQVMKLSEDFQKAGLGNFILEEKDLIVLPEKTMIPDNIKAIDVTPGLIAAVIISNETVQTVTQWNPLDIRMLMITPLIMNM